MDLEKEESNRQAELALNPDADRGTAVRPGRRGRSELLLPTEVQMGPRWALSIRGKSGCDQLG